MLTPHGSTEPASYRRPSDKGQVEAIVTAAEGCFSRAGYAGASMREIAEAAGVSKSLLHYHFQSKEHLFVEVQIRAYDRLASRVSSAVAPLATGKDRGLVAFDVLIAALRETNDLAVQAELWAGALSSDKLRTHVVRLREFFRDLLVRSIAEILGPDLDRVGISAEAAADLVWSVLNGIGIESAFGAPAQRVDNAVNALRLLAGIALASPPPAPAPAPPRALKPHTKKGVAPLER